MAKTNVVEKKYTHQGGPASHISPIEELKRSVLACMLWEKEFYESGEDIGSRIRELVHKCRIMDVADLAIKARTENKLRHAPLLLLREMARHAERHNVPSLVADTIAEVIQRPDELAELVSLYWLEGRQPLSGQMKKGLARAFNKFNEYQLAKWNRDGAVKLRDVFFLCHPLSALPEKDEARKALYTRLAEGKLKTPDTWEVALSGGADKKETWTRMLREGNLGYMALLKNLRNMQESGVAVADVRKQLVDRAAGSKALPFRFVAAARACPSWEYMIDEAMQNALQGISTLKGKTLVLVDISYSMRAQLSAKSDLKRMDAAAALATLVAGIAEDFEIHTFTTDVKQVPSRKGMGLIDAIVHNQEHQNTFLGKAVTKMNQIKADRLIIITDEQSHDRVPGIVHDHAYIINVASNKNGVAYGQTVHLTGFSESVIDWIREYEA